MFRDFIEYLGREGNRRIESHLVWLLASEGIADGLMTSKLQLTSLRGLAMNRNFNRSVSPASNKLDRANAESS